MAVDTGPARPAANGVDARGRARIGQRTLRTDNWLQSPLTTGGILTVFIVYSTIRIFMNDHFFVGQFHYLTPMYSPCISEECPPEAADFGTWVGSMPAFIPIAIFFFWILGGFRVTCYYYRKAGYRSLWLSPQACAVPEPHKKYSGETRFPLVFMNSHRYFFWLASILLLVNFYDAVKALSGEDGFRIGLGTLIMWVNVVMLALYSLSCHACRHAVGGRINHFSKHPVRYKLWTWVSKLNPRHGTFAMTSLFTVILTDAYIMILSIAADGGANTLPGWL